MSANRLKHSQSGFTLIEVTLAIVIGVVVIAGATVLYNQAKNSAASSAAQGKVAAASSTIEEFAAKNFGKYPDNTQFTRIWQRTRPDDFAQSPWGGATGNTAGVVAADGWGTLPTTETAADDALVGVIEYQKGDDTETKTIFDMQIDGDRYVRNYAVWIYDGKGQGPNFVMGGKAQQPTAPAAPAE